MQIHSSDHFLSFLLVRLSHHFILCCPLLLLPSVFPSIRIFSSESALCIRWPKYWKFSFSNTPSNDYSGLISFRIDWFDLCCPRDSQESSPAQFCGVHPSLWSSSPIFFLHYQMFFSQSHCPPFIGSHQKPTWKKRI